MYEYVLIVVIMSITIGPFVLQNVLTYQNGKKYQNGILEGKQNAYHMLKNERSEHTCLQTSCLQKKTLVTFVVIRFCLQNILHVFFL